MITFVWITKFPKSSKSLVEWVLSGEKSVGMVTLGAAIFKSSKNLEEKDNSCKNIASRFFVN